VATEVSGTPAALLALALFEPGPVGPAAEQGVHLELGGRDVVELECCLGRLGNPADGAAHAARGRGGRGQGFCHQGGPDRTRRPQGGSPHDGLARGVHMLFALINRAQVWGRNALDDGGECLLRKDVSGLLGDL
jgi:hypothetical protein